MAIENYTLNVTGMSCSHCENSIKKSVGSLNGVKEVSVILSDNKVTVEFDSEKVDITIIKDTIEDEGYTVK